MFEAAEMTSHRSAGRNILIEFSSAPGEIQGGLCAPDNLEKAQFLDMLNVVFSAPGGFDARLHGSSVALTPTNEYLEHGHYTLTPCLPGEMMRSSSERFFPRTRSASSTMRTTAFRDRIRSRDCRCVVTSQPCLGAKNGRWSGFETAHIFPLALENIFISQGYPQLITGHDGINSPQNGLLLRSDLHNLWDDYSISVNPHDGYKVYAFLEDGWFYHGNILHPTCRQPGDAAGVLDALLRWHFEQAALCNMRGTGEPLFEFDFPPGSDIMGEIQQGPQAEERMEAELFGRLHGLYDPFPQGLSP